MKKLTLIITMLILTVLLAFSATALSISSPSLGGENQDRISNVTATFIVTNNGTTALTDVAISENLPTEYNARLDKTTIATLAVGAQETITLTVDIPLTFNAVQETKSATDYLKLVIPTIGQVTANDGTTAFNADVKLQAANKLEIKKARLVCGDKSEKLDDGDKVKNLKPDTECTIEVEVENNFDDDDKDDQLIGDIDFDPVTIEIESLDDELDLDEDEEINNLGGKEEDTINVNFDIEEDTDDGTYNVEIRIYGDDDNGAFHGEIWKIKLDVERLNHDIQIKRPTITPTKISTCKDNTVKVSSTIINLGRRDEDKVKVEIEIPDLDLQKERTNMVLDEDDSTSLTFNLMIPKDTKAGVYAVNINTYFDHLAPSRTETLEIVVEKCEEVETEVIVEDKTPVVTTPIDDTQTAAGPRTRTRSSILSDSPLYLWALGGVGVVLVVFILLLLSVLFRRPPVIE